MDYQKVMAELLSANIKKEMAERSQLKKSQLTMDWNEYIDYSAMNDVTEWVKPDFSDVLNSKEVRRSFTVEFPDDKRLLNEAAKAWFVHLVNHGNVQIGDGSETTQSLRPYSAALDALYSVNFDMEAFIREEKYKNIPEEELFDLLMYVYMPIMDPYATYEERGVELDYLDRRVHLSWVEGEKLRDTDILLHMITGVRCVQDYWNMMGTGVGDIKSLYHFFMKPEDSILDLYFHNCAYGMLRNIILSYEREHEYSSLYRTPYGKKAHDLAYDLLVNKYLNLYDKSFFTTSNWEMIQRAWYSGIDSIVEYMKGCEQAQKYIARLQAFEGLKDGDMFEFEMNGVAIKGSVKIRSKNDFSIKLLKPFSYSSRMRDPTGSYSFVEEKDGVYYTNESACCAADMMLLEILHDKLAEKVFINHDEDNLVTDMESSCSDTMKTNSDPSWLSVLCLDL